MIEAFDREIRDLNTLVEQCPALRPWLRIATAACGRGDLDPDEYGGVLLGESVTVGMGEPPGQASLAGGASTGVSD